MNKPLSWARTVDYVHERANEFCEYCQTSYRLTGITLHVEHIIPGAGDAVSNLCLACATCNLSKASAVISSDPENGDVVPLFNPRSDSWYAHFAWHSSGLEIIGLTSIGRATVARLNMNNPGVTAARRNWLITKLHPPTPEETKARLP